MIRDHLLKSLTPEQIEKVKDCENSDEILKLAKEEGIELTNEQLEAISGGFSLCYPDVSDLWCTNCCDYCYNYEGGGKYVCKYCGDTKQY